MLLHFPKASEEDSYRRWKLDQTRSKSRSALLFAAGAFAVFGIKEWWVLPHWLALVTCVVQLGVIAPGLLITAHTLGKISHTKVHAIVLFGWIVSIFPLIALLIYAQANDYPLPYEGLLIAIPFVYVLSGLEAITAAILTSLSIVLYLVGITAAGLDGGTAFTQGFYLFTSNLIGVVGAMVHNDLSRRTYISGVALEEKAYQDSLTGLSNRRSIEQTFEVIWRLAARTRESITIFYVDIDFFKGLNDTLGHHTGDLALCRVARALSSASGRSMDTVGRIGGEEFAILCYALDEPGVEKFAEKVRAAVEKEGIPHPVSPLSQYITVSVGGARYLPEKFQEVDFRLWSAADAALYEAKHKGRNRVVSKNNPDLDKFEQGDADIAEMVLQEGRQFTGPDISKPE